LFPLILGRKLLPLLIGGYHSLAITKNGNIFIWGHAGNGELGTGDIASSLLPQLLTIPTKSKIFNVQELPYQKHTISSDAHLGGDEGGGEPLGLEL
jgi:alpha-tubulin suppressor-like RCC1 family protein